MIRFKTEEGRLKRWARIASIVAGLLTAGSIVSGGTVTVYEWATPAPECFGDE